ncbi:MAG: hypothetical protein ABFD91_06540 [Anaerohalosphaeraceae bacterium]
MVPGRKSTAKHLNANSNAWTGGNLVDKDSPVASAIVFEVIRHAFRYGNFSDSNLQSFIGSVASQYGANANLVAHLMRGLPYLYKELSAYDPTHSNTIIANTPTVKFRIWAEGKILVAATLDQYEKHKNKYLFWIDLDSHKNNSLLAPGQQLKPMSIRLLKCLVENLGSPVSLLKIRQTIGDPDATSISKEETEVISQSLSRLNTFCGSKLSSYYSRDWKQKGLGLNISFKDKYFLYERY